MCTSLGQFQHLYQKDLTGPDIFGMLSHYRNYIFGTQSTSIEKGNLHWNIYTNTMNYNKLSTLIDLSEE